MIQQRKRCFVLLERQQTLKEVPALAVSSRGREGQREVLSGKDDPALHEKVAREVVPAPAGKRKEEEQRKES